MSPTQTANYITDNHMDLEKEINDLDPRLMNALLSKLQQQNAAVSYPTPPEMSQGNSGGAPRSLPQGGQGPIPYGSGSLHHTSGVTTHLQIPQHQPQQAYNPGMRGLSPYGPQYPIQQQQQQQQQHMYGHHLQGGYHQHHIDNGGFQPVNPGTSPYYHPMQPGHYGQPQQQFPVTPQEQFVPYSAKNLNEAPKVDSSVQSSFLAIRGQDLIDFCLNMVKIDPYISSEACKEILAQKFPELASNRYKVTFGALMAYYKSSQKCQEVPPNIVVMLSTIADAMGSSTGHGKQAIADEGDSINNRSQAATTSLNPQKRKRGRPKKIPDSDNPLGMVEVSKTGESAVSIMCNGKPGLFRLQRQTCDFYCDICILLKNKLGVEELDMSPKEFERHSGMGHMKKWRSSIQVNNPMYKGPHGKSLGALLTAKNIETISARGIHDKFIRTYAKPPAKGVPACVTETLIEEIEGAVVLPLPAQVEAKSDSTQGEELTHTEALEEEEVQIKRKVGRPKKIGLAKEEKSKLVWEAKRGKKEAQVVSWKILDSFNLSMEVSYGRALYSGVLDLVKVLDIEENKVDTIPQAKVVESTLPPKTAEEVPPKTAEEVPPKTAEEVPPKTAEEAPPKTAEEAPSTSLPKSASKIKSSKSPTSQEQGPQGTRHPLTCTLCGGPNEEPMPNVRKGYFDRTEQGLGALKSVKISSTSTAMIHNQCARWSPEVHDPTGGGTLVGVKDAIVRGRRLKCKLCGKKGATIGCFSKRCKSSFHLPCARKECVLKANPYFVCCQDHKRDFFPEATN